MTKAGSCRLARGWEEAGRVQGGAAVAGRTLGPSGLPSGGCPKVRVSTEAGSHGKRTGIPSRSGMSPSKRSAVG